MKMSDIKTRARIRKMTREENKRDRACRTLPSCYDGNGKPVPYQKPLTYNVDTLAGFVNRQEDDTRNLQFNHIKRTETSQAGIDKAREYSRTRQGRRALRTILHAKMLEHKRIMALATKERNSVKEE